jgi:hypothetical protein
MKSLIDRYNDLVQELPPEYNISALASAAFQPVVDTDSEDLVERVQEALWSFEFLRLRSLSSLDLQHGNNIWRENPEVREVINHYLRRCRAEEEIALLKKEAEQSWDWTVQIISSLIASALAHNASARLLYLQELRNLAWDHLAIIEAWIKVTEEQILDEERRENTIGTASFPSNICTY